MKRIFTELVGLVDLVSFILYYILHETLKTPANCWKQVPIQVCKYLIKSTSLKLQLLQYNLYNNFSKLDGQLTMQVQSIACACKVMTFIIVKAKPKSSDEASTVL